MSEQATRAHVHAETLAASPERVFAALITPSAIRDWWSASHAIVLAEPGGVWAATWGSSEDEPDYVTVATIREIVAARLLTLVDYRYRSKQGPLPFAADFSTRFELEPAGERTLLRVTQSGFPCTPAGDEFLRGCERGWRDTFAGLARHLAAARRG